MPHRKLFNKFKDLWEKECIEIVTTSNHMIWLILKIEKKEKSLSNRKNTITHKTKKESEKTKCQHSKKYSKKK
jgi:hypothetical protein